MTDPSDPATAPRRARRRGVVALSTLRAVTTLHVLALVAQPVWAGLLLSGDYDMVAVHRAGANVAFVLGFAQVLAAVACWRTSGLRWPVAASLTLSAAENAQYAVGSAGALDLHVPLGVAVIVLGVLLLVAAWRPVTEVEATVR